MAIVRATEPFSYTDAAGVPRIVNTGQLFDDADPCVVKRPNLFERVEVAAARVAAATETATAAPGEARSVSRPRLRKHVEPAETAQ